MAKQVAWNAIVLGEFVKLGGLNDFETQLMYDRMRGMTRTQMSIEYNCSLATIDRTIKKLKKVYDDVQPHSDILKPRKFSAQETYMDEH